MFRSLSARLGVGCATFAVSALVATAVSAQCGTGNFNGFSIGLDTGYFRSEGNSTYTAPLAAFPASVPFAAGDTNYGPLVGTRFGYNLQCGSTVYGFEADWAFAFLRGSATYTDPFLTPLFGNNQFTTTTKLRDIGTLRARVGLIGMNSWLLYGTGGLAFGNVTHSVTFRYFGLVPDTFSSEDKSFKVGWSAGLGIERSFGQWSLRAEALYVDLANTSLAFGLPGAFGTPADQTAKWDNVFLITRLGMTYRY